MHSQAQDQFFLDGCVIEFTRTLIHTDTHTHSLSSMFVLINMF